MKLKSFFTPTLIGKFHSKFNGQIIVSESFGKKIIYVDGAEQTGGTITGMWRKSISKVKSQKLRIDNCLILGLGGGDVIKIIKRAYPRVKIVCVEIDPVMIEIARRYFQITSSTNLQIIKSDAFDWVKNYQGNKFDLIVIDLYIGKYNPAKSHETAFIKDIKSILESNGLILFNSHFDKSDTKSFNNLLRVCKEMFHRVEDAVIYHYSRVLLLG